MAMICFGSFWLVVMPQLRGPQMYPAGLRGGFCPPSYRQQVSEQIFPACSPCLFLWFKLLIRFFFFSICSDLERGQGQPYVWWEHCGGVLEVMGGVGMSSCGSFPVLWTFR